MPRRPNNLRRRSCGTPRPDACSATAMRCEHAPVSRVAAKWGLAPETVRRLDKRVLRRWAASRPRPPRRYLGVDELFLGKLAFPTVVSDLETGEPIWLGRERQRETLDRFFAEALPCQRGGRRDPAGGVLPQAWRGPRPGPRQALAAAPQLDPPGP